jgi:hypothetical protein
MVTLVRRFTRLTEDGSGTDSQAQLGLEAATALSPPLSQVFHRVLLPCMPLSIPEIFSSSQPPSTLPSPPSYIIRYPHRMCCLRALNALRSQPMLGSAVEGGGWPSIASHALSTPQFVAPHSLSTHPHASPSATKVPIMQAPIAGKDHAHCACRLPIP